MRVSVSIERFELLSTDPLRRLLRRERVLQIGVREWHSRVEDIAAGNIDISGNAHEAEQGANGLKRVQSRMIGSVAEDQTSRLRPSIQARRARDHVWIAPSNIGHTV